VGVLDTATSAFSTIATTGDAASGNYKYYGAVAVGTVVYFAPSYQNNVGVLDTATSAFSTIATTGDAASGSLKYSGAVAVGTVVYFGPLFQNNVGVLTLPASPSLPPASAAGISGDPHLKGAHGEEADFKGEHGAVYSALSARNLSLNLLVEHAAFTSPFSRLNVRGSWVKAAYHTVRTKRTGRMFQIFFHAIDPHHAIVTEGCTAPHCTDQPNGRRHVLTEGAPAFSVENVAVLLRRRTLSIANGQWRTTAVAAVGAPHAGKPRLNVEVKPTYAVDYDPVAPHGLLGQTYDRDGLEVNGRQDDYSRLDDGRPTASRTGVGGIITTRAKAEGAIEGSLEAYRVTSDFSTAFRYSRFDATAAPVRNVSALSGKLGPRHAHAHPSVETG